MVWEGWEDSRTSLWRTAGTAKPDPTLRSRPLATLTMLDRPTLVSYIGGFAGIAGPHVGRRARRTSGVRRCNGIPARTEAGLAKA